jgi:hypothetical protein
MRKAGFSTRHPEKSEPAATASTGLFPTPFLIRILFYQPEAVELWAQKNNKTASNI